MKRPVWHNYRKWLLTTKVHMRDAGTSGNPKKGIAALPMGYVSAGELLSFMVDHPVWGVAARTELRDEFVAAVTLPHGWSRDVVAADPDLICRCMAIGHSWRQVRRWTDMWGPDGPFDVGDAWRHDLDFEAWWEAQGGTEDATATAGADA